jgi:hypothetical protein
VLPSVLRLDVVRRSGSLARVLVLEIAVPCMVIVVPQKTTVRKDARLAMEHVTRRLHRQLLRRLPVQLSLLSLTTVAVEDPKVTRA